MKNNNKIKISNYNNYKINKLTHHNKILKQLTKIKNKNIKNCNILN